MPIVLSDRNLWPYRGRAAPGPSPRPAAQLVATLGLPFKRGGPPRNERIGETLSFGRPTRRSELQLAENEQDDEHDNNHPDDTDPAIAAHAASCERTGPVCRASVRIYTAETSRVTGSGPGR